MRWLLLISAVAALSVAQQDWDASNFPNPASDFQKCQMTGASNLCDPEGLLSPETRTQVDSELKQFESRTRNDSGRTFCEKRGVTPVMAVLRKVRGGTPSDERQLAADLLNRWSLDEQCRKALAMVLSMDDHKLSIARQEGVPISDNEFAHIFEQQRPLFEKLDYKPALVNVIQSMRERALIPLDAVNKTIITTRNRTVTVDEETTTILAEESSSEWSFRDFLLPFILLLLLLTLFLVGLCCFLKRRSARRHRDHREIGVVNRDFEKDRPAVVRTDVRNTPSNSYVVAETTRTVTGAPVKDNVTHVDNVNHVHHPAYIDR
ncbi:unnamed protein product [Caenorhabditis auriculariae]|uniref:Uncharacterized protein n=1 Tax=Caenorhabditis auriculariae TaxID=2777116 RepID=A0A8S1HDN7_9PELO|nr:unnamed protein product [Caenorhabditis auriculariae]